MSHTVTTIGGGTGSFNVLSGLRTHAEVYVQAIVSTMDSGGDSGRLRDEFGVLPPGDIRRCLVALSEETQLMRELFSYRFTDPPLQGRSFGNLFFLALSKSLGSQKRSHQKISSLSAIPVMISSIWVSRSALISILSCTPWRNFLTLSWAGGKQVKVGMF